LISFFTDIIVQQKQKRSIHTRFVIAVKSEKTILVRSNNIPVFMEFCRNLFAVLII